MWEDDHGTVWMLLLMPLNHAHKMVTTVHIMVCMYIFLELNK